MGRKPSLAPSAIIPATIPATAAHLFPEYDVATLDPAEKKAANVIIQRLLEGGTREELRWLFAACGQARVAEWVRERGLRGLSRKAFAYWRLVLGVKEYRRPPWMKKTDDPYPDPAPGLWGR